MRWIISEKINPVNSNRIGDKSRINKARRNRSPSFYFQIQTNLLGDKMNDKQTPNMSGSTVVVQRVIIASAVRRLHSDITRQKKSKKALRRMKKETDQ